MNEFGKVFPWIVVVLGGAMLLWVARPPADDGLIKVHEFGKIPVVDGGRVKPYETLARDSLMMISGRQSFEDEAGNRKPAVRWLLDVLSERLDPKTGRPVAHGHRVFRIENEQVLDMLGLEARPGFRYALREFSSDEQLRDISEQAQRAGNKDEAQRDTVEHHVLQLARRMQLYRRLVAAHTLVEPGNREQALFALQQWQSIAEAPLTHSVPPHEAEEEWRPLLLASLLHVAGASQNPAVPSLYAIFRAYADGDAATFNQEVAAYRARLGQTMPADLSKARVESWFKGFAPFYHSAILYLVVFVLCCLAWLGWAGPLNKAAFYLAALILVVHTAALGVRMYLDGRPPVTNLYGSAVFVGWGCVLLGLILEWFFRNGLGVLVASVTGFMSLLVAHNLAADGTDTLGVLVAVLDTNFWLATHVTTVTLGYTATFVAGFLGIVYILRGLFTRSLHPEARKQLSKMIYGTVCFALLLSFVGTVLGGIWADQSWGRFWGWDPKENGALIIVLWNALILHARWGGMVQQRGIAALAVFGNIVVTWSWFGVNELGAGLHSYGFTEGTLKWLSIFVLSQLAIIAVGSLPLWMWRSYAAPKLPPEPQQRPGRKPPPLPAN